MVKMEELNWSVAAIAKEAQPKKTEEEEQQQADQNRIPTQQRWANQSVAPNPPLAGGNDRGQMWGGGYRG